MYSFHLFQVGVCRGISRGSTIQIAACPRKVKCEPRGKPLTRLYLDALFNNNIPFKIQPLISIYLYHQTHLHTDIYIYIYIYKYKYKLGNNFKLCPLFNQGH